MQNTWCSNHSQFGNDLSLLSFPSTKRQQRDIKDAIAKWQDYKKRKAQGD